MSVLEEKIKKNKELFDKSEPSDGHFDRFNNKLNSLHSIEVTERRKKLFPYAKVAAVIILLMAVGAVLIITIPDRSLSTAAASDLPAELLEAKDFYNAKVNKKMEQIDQCAATGEDAVLIKNMVNQEINELDKQSEELENVLKEDTDNQRVKNALINNYKTKSELLDNIIYRMCNI
jgi:hypothetical protein